MLFLWVLLSWIACLSVYLSSPKQQLVNKNLAKIPAWGIFFIALLVAFLGLNSSYGYLVSALILLLLTMTMWTLLVFIAAHFAKRLFIVNALAISLFFIITAVTFIGEVHVA